MQQTRNDRQGVLSRSVRTIGGGCNGGGHAGASVHRVLRLASCAGLLISLSVGSVLAKQPSETAPAGSTSTVLIPAVGPRTVGLPEGVTDLAPMIEPIRKKHQVPAMGALVLVNGKVIAGGAVGRRRVNAPEMVTFNDRWHLGSCTKSMTATLCAILVQRGKLRWEQTLAETFPEQAEKMHADFRGVTLKQLLSHRGGVPGDLRKDGLWSKLWNFKGSTTEARRLILTTVTKDAPKPSVGSFEYSNGGVALAGLMAEQVTGKSWEELMRTEVFTPLGITSAGFGAPGSAESNDEPCGHVSATDPVLPGLNADNPAAIGPAGTVHMSLSDWAKYVAAHLDGETMRRLKIEQQPLDEASVNTTNAGKAVLLRRPGDLVSGGLWETLHTPMPQMNPKDAEYALGWSVTRRPWASDVQNQTPPGRVITHAGSNTMWYCVVWAAQDRDFAVLVTANRAGDAVKAADEIAAKTIGKFCPKPAEATGTKEPTEKKTPGGEPGVR
ncbi:MAG: beta-lactamase family protein [Phycisphaerales bacterium]|nr:beta-lactamase family protein [Phycisphaerales bacterium]